MYVESVPNRNSPPAILLRESVRIGAKVQKRTLSNLSSWPAAQLDLLRRVLKGEDLVARDQALQIRRSLPHGHVAAVLGTLRHLGLPDLLSRARCPERDLICALITARILDPRSKLATARGLDDETAFSSLAESLHLTSPTADDLYEAMDWLLPRQQRIEQALAKRHLSDGCLVLYDVTSTYFEGRHCPLARFGHSRDERSGNPQIVCGLLTNAEGCPVAVEVFPGNTPIPKPSPRKCSNCANVLACSDWCWSVIVACSPAPAFARISSRFLASSGLPRYARRPSRDWPPMACCNFPCSTRRTWPRSLTRRFPVSG